MSGGRPAEKQMIAYLLGELSEADSLRLEQSCMDNEDFFEELLAVEAELTDAYVQGQLVGGTREAFEKRLLNSPDGGKAIALSKLITRRDTSRSPAPTIHRKEASRWSLAWLSAPGQLLRFPLAAAAILIIGISLGVLFRKQQTSESHVPTAQLAQPAAPNTTPAPSLQRPVVIATFVISAGGERETGNVNEIRVPTAEDHLRLQVDLGNGDYKGYRAALKMIDGKEAINLNDVQSSRSASGVTVFIQLATSELPPGDSMLTITGFGRQRGTDEVVGRYFVRRLR
jgi:anti-sigma factor RsiW